MSRASEEIEREKRPGGRGGKLRAALENRWLRAVRFYTYHTPITRGRHVVYLCALKFCRNLPRATEVPTKDGRLISIDFATGMHSTVFFLGEYETAVTGIVVELLREGDVCLDVGANFGWYTTVFQKYAGKTGAVHAFEPVPVSFRELSRNYELMGRPANVHLNNLALGDENTTVRINLFPDQPTGHASLSEQGRDDSIVFDCRMITLDSYLEEKRTGDVNFIKVDIEGAELKFLEGAAKVFEQKIPPILLMEMALQQTKNFGYTPNDLIEYIGSRAAYEFFEVDEIRGKLRKIEGFAEGQIGANVICLPRDHYRDRINLKDWLI